MYIYRIPYLARSHVCTFAISQPCNRETQLHIHHSFLVGRSTMNRKMNATHDEFTGIYWNLFQEKLLHIRLLQRMLRRTIVARRSREDPNMDQATSRSGTGGLGSFFFYVYDFFRLFSFYSLYTFQPTHFFPFSFDFSAFVPSPPFSYNPLLLLSPWHLLSSHFIRIRSNSRSFVLPIRYTSPCPVLSFLCPFVFVAPSRAHVAGGCQHLHTS